MRHYNFRSAVERFWAHVTAGRAEDCWIWSGALTRHGYGRLRVGGRREAFAHRLSYEIHVGSIADGLVIDHICFNRACVNPAHLRAITQRQNARNLQHDPGIKPDRECINGHAMTAANTYINPRGRGECRTCIRERVRRYVARRAAASA